MKKQFNTDELKELEDEIKSNFDKVFWTLNKRFSQDVEVALNNKGIRSSLARKSLYDIRKHHLREALSKAHRDYWSAVVTSLDAHNLLSEGDIETQKTFLK